MAIEFHPAPGYAGNDASRLEEYLVYMENIGLPQEALLTTVLVTLFIVAVFFFLRSDRFGPRRR